MPGDADVAAVAALIGERARAAVLMALADGRVHSATTLADEAGVAQSTLSVHLAHLEPLGVVLDRRGRRPLVRYCVDGSERRPHIAGAVGAALLELFVARRWVTRVARRVVRVTTSGRTAFEQELGVHPKLGSGG
jgi:DNA-binding transcriptional ArsR family regulator